MDNTNPDAFTTDGQPLGDESQGPPAPQMEQHPHHQPSSLVSRACDACRARKVRCDKLSPCSSCRSLKIDCRSSPKVQERRQRIIISNRYETQIESIDGRLSGIEEALRQLTENIKNVNLNAKNRTPTIPPHKGTPKASPAPSLSATQRTKPSAPISSPSVDVNTAYEGDTSLLAHSLHAQGLFEKLATYSFTGQSLSLKNAVKVLQEMLKTQCESSISEGLRFSSEPPEGEFVMSEAEMPPLQEVIQILRLASVNNPIVFLMYSISFDDFFDMCKSYYFALEDCSLSHFTVINWGLYGVFYEYSAKPEFEDRSDELQRYAKLCRHNFESAVDSFPLSISPSLDTCQALLLGALHATDVSKPTLCRRMATTAAHMAMALGYHRLNDEVVESKWLRAKKCAFWAIYVFDKGLSLRLGTMSVLQDCDISTTLVDKPDDPSLHAWYDTYMYWMDLAKIQGQVFQELYTVNAMAGDKIKRGHRARRLASLLDTCHHRWQSQLKQGKGASVQPEELQMNIESTEVVYFGVLTIIYRAIPPPPITPANFSVECIVAARKALGLHHKYYARYRKSEALWQIYMNWTILYSPFAPFMVLFVEAVATISVKDLQCLGEFVTSIVVSDDPGKPDTKPARRLYRICDAFYQVAKIYIEDLLAANTTTSKNVSVPGTGLHNSNGQFDQSLANNPLQNPMQNGLLEQFVGTDGDFSWSAEDWFLPDQYMTGMLDMGFRRG
ncbi:hypothetical protein BJ875DRAFT_273731 [Amylocarpus encephaloides]|uniref:Zn(2)-C6 fungal-type domain-containing protein n=1 Tax=Amylocarpus encephaloides TaxID=45428 RepID=A0A9P7Y5Z7_9HELO|nr:hypothetical protein BJ875DRAFT_273731 [Amylocarpus encephaloides]